MSHRAIILRRLLAADRPAIGRHVGRMDFTRAVLVGAADPADGAALLGLAEAQPTDLPGVVEVAVSVLPDHRRRGLGRRLAREAIAQAFAGGAEAAVFVFDPGNDAIAAMMRAPAIRPTARGQAILRRAPQPSEGRPGRAA